jgi:hypothetical protein
MEHKLLLILGSAFIVVTNIDDGNIESNLAKNVSVTVMFVAFSVVYLGTYNRCGRYPGWDTKTASRCVKTVTIHALSHGLASFRDSQRLEAIFYCLALILRAEQLWSKYWQVILARNVSSAVYLHYSKHRLDATEVRCCEDLCEQMSLVQGGGSRIREKLTLRVESDLVQQAKRSWD